MPALLGLEALIAIKRESSREKDRLMLAQLEAALALSRQDPGEDGA